MRKCESFQHENVFEVQLTCVPDVKPKIYLNLTFEVKYKRIKTNSNLNKMYENNLQKVVIFNASNAIWCLCTKHRRDCCG